MIHRSFRHRSLSIFDEFLKLHRVSIKSVNLNLNIFFMVFIEIRWKRKFGFGEKDLFDQKVSEEQKTNRRWTSEVQKKNIRKEQCLSLFEFTVTHNLYTGQERSSCRLYWNYAFKIELSLWFVDSFFTGQAVDRKLHWLPSPLLLIETLFRLQRYIPETYSFY